jgi:glycine/D-amino acid oxidase-like deaminating enzyme
LGGGGGGGGSLVTLIRKTSNTTRYEPNGSNLDGLLSQSLEAAANNLLPNWKEFITVSSKMVQLIRRAGPIHAAFLGAVSLALIGVNNNLFKASVYESGCDDNDIKASGRSKHETAAKDLVLPAPNLRRASVENDVAGLPPPCSIILPVYKASNHLVRLMDSLWAQTYPNLHLIVSIEPSDDADETERILRSHEEQIHRHNTTNLRSITIFRHPHQLHYFANMNFLLGLVNTTYYHYMQTDDTLPPDFYQVLVDCLEANQQAVNCFASGETVIPDDDVVRRQLGNETVNNHRPDPISGPQYVRVETLALHYIPNSNRGVVRRPLLRGQEYTYPRLFENFVTCDQIMVIKQAIAGEMLGAEVGYYKHARSDSVSRSNLPTTKMRLQSAVVDHYVQMYNLAHSYVASSDEFVKKIIPAMQGWLKGYWLHISGNQWPERLIAGADEELIQRIRKPKRIAILGAGIQGCLLALMFRKHGFDVTLIDKAGDIMARTSTAGEGRIHMGLEYSNDPGMGTATLMLHSAMRFASYTEYLVGRPVDWKGLRSERLTCLLPHTSHVSPEEFEAYGERLSQIYESILLEDPSLTYLGEQPPRILLDRVEVPSSVNASFINAAYKSIEVCIFASELREVIRKALARAQIKIVFDRTVTGVRRQPSEYGLGKLLVQTDIGSTHYDVVVNALWEGRATIDRALGLDHNVETESYRVKANVRLPNIPNIHLEIPSVSIMNGPFGDFVRYGPDNQVYFAWHPVSPAVITRNVSDVVGMFEGHVASDFPLGYEQQIIDGHRRAFEMIFPGYDTSFFNEASVSVGYVVANGLTDIDDKSSSLHQRAHPPILCEDGYISVKTQKLTNAPYNVYLLEQALFQKDSFSLAGECSCD